VAYKNPQIKPGMWIKTQEDECLYFHRYYQNNSGSRFGHFREESGREYKLCLDGLVPWGGEVPTHEPLGADDLARNIAPQLEQLVDRVVHFDAEHVCVEMEFSGKRYVVQIMEKL
jgi:hypothetical protein